MATPWDDAEVRAAVELAMREKGTYPRVILGTVAYDHRERVWDILRDDKGVWCVKRGNEYG